MRLACMVCSALALACGNPAPKTANEGTATPKHGEAAKPPLDLPAGGTAVQIVQRHRAALPGSQGAYEIGIGDITAGQVELTLGRTDGSAVLVSRSVRPRDRVAFAIDGHPYELVVDALDNVLVGDDIARLTVRDAQPAAADGPKAELDEHARIDALISAVSTSGIVFIRNGEEHDAAAAADHLRTKWSRAGDRVQTAEDFIENIASRSSQTGEPYRVRLADGTEREAGPWLREQLQAIDAKQ